jgi:hypothetical protein
MQKQSAKSRFMLYKSCISTHKEHNKTKFAFVWFFFDFLQILKESTKKH